jgi:hypothetical protein
LGDTEKFRRPGKTAAICGGYECVKLGQFHIWLTRER